MLSYCKKVNITNIHFIEEAVFNFLKGKTNRKKVSSFFSKILKEHEEIIRLSLIKRDNHFYQMVHKISNIILKDIINESINLTPIRYFERRDKSNDKVRKIAVQGVYQSILDHIIVKAINDGGLTKLIGHWQCASIPNRGCVMGAKRVSGWLANKNMKFYVKVDIKKCYEHITIDNMLKYYKERVRNKKLMWLIELVLRNHGENLAIGSYLSQWSCNLYLSQLWHFISSLSSERRGEPIPWVAYKIFYMDDILFLGSNKRNLKKSAEKAEEFLHTLGLELKPWQVKKVCKDGVDIMGFRCHRGFCTIRRRVYKKIRRALIRASLQYAKSKSMSFSMAQKIIAYNSFLKNSSSSFPREKYSAKFLIKKAKKIVSKVMKPNRKILEALDDFAVQEFLESLEGY